MHRRSLPALLAAPALAQGSWPDRPIRFVVPLPPGGATDVWARLVAEPMSAMLGQPIVIENRSGAGGMVGTEAAARATPDGYTLLFTITTHVQSPVVFRRWPYQPLSDFAPIGRMGLSPLPFVIQPSIPANTLAEFVAWARGRRLDYGSYSAGSTGHAVTQMLSDAERLEMTHVAYRGEAPLLTDMLGGRVTCAIHSMTVAGDYIRSGRLKPLACTSVRRIPSLPEIPTFVDLGYPTPFGLSGFIGLLAPARVPAPVLSRISDAFRATMERPDVLARLTGMDVIPAYLGPEEFAQDIQQVWTAWQEMATAMNLTVD